MKRAAYLLAALALGATMGCSSSGTGTGTTFTRSFEPSQSPPVDTNEPAPNPDQPLPNSDQPLPNSDQPLPNPDQPTPASSQGSGSVTPTCTCTGLPDRCANHCGEVCARCIASPANCGSAISQLIRECLGNQTPNDFGTGGASAIGVPTVDGGH